MTLNTFDQEELVATKDVAKRTGTSSRLWDALRCKGGGPYYVRISSRCVRYRWGDVISWLSERRLTHTGAISMPQATESIS